MVLSLLLISLTPVCSIGLDLFVKHRRFFGRSLLRLLNINGQNAKLRFWADFDNQKLRIFVDCEWFKAAIMRGRGSAKSLFGFELSLDKSLGKLRQKKAIIIPRLATQNDFLICYLRRICNIYCISLHKITLHQLILY